MSLHFVQNEPGDGPDGMAFKVRDLEFTANISFETLDRNIKGAVARPMARWLKTVEAHDGAAIIAAGGPSLASELEFLRMCQKAGDVIFAVNNVPAYLAQNGIIPDCHVMLDSLGSMLEFVRPDLPMVRYYASQCDPAVLDAAVNPVLWTPFMIGIEEAFPELQPPFVGGGTTVGTRAMGLAYQLGYRKFRLFGLDSSHDGERHHAYYQGGYEHILDVKCGGKDFKCPPQLLAQAEEFQTLLPEMMANGCEVIVYGNGLIRTIADELLKMDSAKAA